MEDQPGSPPPHPPHPPHPPPPHQPGKLQRAPFESALHHAGNGSYQRLLLCACGAVYAACALSTTTLSFVLPSAQCDFELTSADKGKLNATPLIGMCVGSYLWGNLADARGRKWAIVGALLTDAAAALLSSLAQSFPLFLVCRFFSGFGIIGATGLIFPYFGDFLSLRHRDVMLCRLEVFWTLGTILLPGIAWGIIPQAIFDLTSEGAAFQFNSWRMFVALCGAPSLLVAAALAQLPESPRYLLHAGRADSALRVLRDIYVANTGCSADTFPVESMVSGEDEGEGALPADDNANVDKAAPGPTLASPASQVSLTWAQRREAFWRRKQTLTAKPYVGLLALCCFVDFGLMFSYYTLMMWFPDLFERFAQYTGSDAGVCEVSSSLASWSENSSGFKCVESVDRKALNPMVYVYTLVIGLSCLPTSLCVGLTINRVGKKTMLVMMLMSSGLAALGLNFVHSALQNLVLSCVFEAIISCTEAVLFCVICEIFPTSVAGTATAVTVTCGRVGAIVGNVLFGALVDRNCRVPIYIFGGLLVSSGLLCLVLPRTTRPERQT